MQTFESDLLDLCRLNQLEEKASESTAPDAQDTIKAINWKRQNLTNRLIQEANNGTVN